jgi:dipeptidase E
VKLLLLSNSSNYGGAYLDHAREAIEQHFADAERIAFVPYALADLDGYARTAATFFERLGIEVLSCHERDIPATALTEVDGVFVGGGNTFRLLDRLYRYGLVHAIRTRVAAGLPYMGASAGTNVACPTIRTTNDMPIICPPSFEALNLVSFQINAHYLDPVEGLEHMGETRETRLTEFLEEDGSSTVIGLREGSWLSVTDSDVELVGGEARLFRAGHRDELTPGSVAAALT